VCWGWRFGNESLDPPLHLSEIDSRVAARPIGEPHGQAEHRELTRDVPQTRHHIALAGDGDHRARPPLADHAPCELASRRDEHRHLVAARNLEHPVERLFRQAAGNQDQQLTLPHPATTPLRQRVVDVDRGVLDKVALAEAAGEQRAVVHEL